MKLMACIGLFGLLVGACMVPAAAEQSTNFDAYPMTNKTNDSSTDAVAVPDAESIGLAEVIDIGPSVSGVAMAALESANLSIASPASNHAHQGITRCTHLALPVREPGWRV